MLRNMRTPHAEWGSDMADVIKGNRGAVELARIRESLLNRSSMQPEEKRPAPESLSESLDSGWDRWEDMADKNSGIEFVDYTGAKDAVVLGGPQNRESMVVFGDAPQSLRELEDEMEFEA